MRFAKVLLTAFLMMAVSCGYHASNGKAALLPPNLKTVAIPAFGNLTARYKLSDVMPQAFSNEFIAHTRYRIVTDPGQADMILTGNILSYAFNPTIFDAAAQRAQGVPLRSIARHMLGLYHAQAGGRFWRQILTMEGQKRGAGVEVILRALTVVEEQAARLAA